MDSFTNIAPYYDLLMRKIPYKDWLKYYQSLLRKNKLYPSSFLDLCCGTGTLSEILAQQGKQVEGMDLSRVMIQQAKIKANQKKLFIPYYVKDATQFSLDHQYDSVYSFFDSLNYILDREALLSCFKCVYNHLTKEGIFVFDLNTAYAFESNFFDQEELSLNAPIRYIWKGNYQSENRLMTVTMDFWVDGKHFQETHFQKAHEIQHILVDLQLVGFKSVKCYQSYTYKKPSKYSDRVHVIALKN